MKMVRDGPEEIWYPSGFHIFPELETARHYLRKFRKPRRVDIWPAEVDPHAGVWAKWHSPADIMLAKKIKLMKPEGS
jgi:hypothetical protein